MSISKKKSLVNGKDTAKAQEKDTITENIAKFKEIEREMTSAQPVILSGKDKKNFKELCDNIKNSLCPQNEVENDLINQIACSEWKFGRLEVIMQEVLEEYADKDGRIRWGDLLRTNYLKKIARHEQRIKNYILELIYKFKDRPVLSPPAKGKSMNLLVKSGVC